MSRHISPHNQTSVPVLDKGGTPLAPTRPSRARRWLETGKAVRCWKHGRFAVQLVNHQADDCTVPEMNLGIDPGTRKTGMAVTVQTQEGPKVVAAVEIHHRGSQITSAMTTRSSLRNNRRGRLRRRPARFDNRTRKPGWLQPTLASIQANILTNVKHLRDLFPISKALLESCKFDPRLMWDPTVSGKEYQESERGRMQVREYVLQRDERTCQYCGTRKGRIEVDHVVPRSENGSDRVSNLVTSCRKRNQKKDNRSLAEFLKRKPTRLKKIEAQLKRSLSSASHMNYLMHLLRRELKEQGVPMQESDAISTAYTRKALGVKKTHANDAACLVGPEKLINVPTEVTVVRSVGHGKRQMLSTPSKNGTPRVQDRTQGEEQPLPGLLPAGKGGPRIHHHARAQTQAEKGEGNNQRGPDSVHPPGRRGSDGLRHGDQTRRQNPGRCQRQEGHENRRCDTPRKEQRVPVRKGTERDPEEELKTGPSGTKRN